MTEYLPTVLPKGKKTCFLQKPDKTAYRPPGSTGSYFALKNQNYEVDRTY